MKRIKVLLTVPLALSLLLAGCATTTTNTNTSTDISSGTSTGTSTDAPTDVPLSDGVWENVCGSYVWDESSQYTNSVLSMMWLDYGSVLFEFNLMKGSEEEDSAIVLTVSGVLNVQENGGIYEVASDDGESRLLIQFEISEDGDRVTVSHEGEILISPDGNYSFTESGMEVSDYSATEFLRYLPAAATGLDADLGAYTLNYPETLTSGWFYPIDVTSDSSGENIARFIVAKDLSAVFRVDDDIEPVLIYGSAQPMMDAEVYPEFDDEYNEGSEDEVAEEFSYDPISTVSVGTDNGTFLTVGESTALVVDLPWELPFTLEACSADTSIAVVDENGVITGVTLGETSIIGTLTVENGVKEFEIIINVLDVETTEG